VQSLSRAAANLWQATLDDGATYEASTAFLATGKHDLRGHGRPKTLTNGSASRCITACLPPNR